jgi:AAA+ ATPase superfamily predicted ATPase
LLAVVYGRRRVGKTALIEQAFADDTVWKFEGIEAGDRQTQLGFFAKQLSHYLPSGQLPAVSRWEEAFEALGRAIAEHEEQHSGRLVLFLDEFQWLCAMKAAVVAVFKYYWDNLFAKHSQCVFVLCGSVSSFLVKKVVQSRALYGRVDLEIHLRPLSLRETQQFLRRTPSAAQGLDTYMVLGGVPQYLLELNPALSLHQNLNEYAFRSSGFFFREFDRLFVSHFAQHPTYEQALRALSERRMTPTELAAKCQLTGGGTLSARIKELELAGFVRVLSPVDKPPNSRLIQYSLDDEYLHFYFRFIEPHSAEIVSGNVSFSQLAASRAFEQWRGYAFERLCRKHARQFADHLRFGGVSHRSGAWFQRGTANRAGGQIDLLFVRADKVLTVCEMEYADRLDPRKVVSAFEGRLDLLRAAFPGYALEKVLVLGKSAPSLDQLRPHFDHVLTADEVLLG